MINKKYSIIILIIILLGFIFSCTGNDVANLPEHLKAYFSSKALYSIPDDSFMVIKFDSIAGLHNTLKIDSLLNIFSESMDFEIRDFLDINTLLDKGFDIDKPVIFSLRLLDNGEERFEERMFIQIAIPYQNEEKAMENILNEDTDYQEMKINNYTLMVADGNIPAFFFKDKYIFMVGSPFLVHNETIISEVEYLTDIPQEKSLRKSETYREHMLNMNPDSVINFYMNFSLIADDLYDFFPSGMDMSSLDRLDEMDYGLVDLYLYEKSMGTTAYTAAIEGSDIFSEKNIIPDFIKKIPEYISMISYSKTNINASSLKTTINSFIMYCKMMGIEFAPFEDIFGMNLNELISIFNGETGFAIVNFKNIFAGKIMVSLGITDIAKAEQLLKNVNEYLKKEFELEITEENGKYIIQIKNLTLPYNITYGIVNNMLLITTHKDFFDSILSSNENITEKVNSENLKKAIESDKCANIFHIKLGEMVEAFSEYANMFLGKEGRRALQSMADLIIEVNGFGYNMTDHHENVFEVLFNKENYLIELYQIFCGLNETFASANFEFLSTFFW